MIGLVKALRYYLDKTSDLRQNKELVFVSFKKGFDKDISPVTFSSWIKQTVILSYELSDQQALTLHQVKAHDVRAFTVSKAFQSGVSLELKKTASFGRFISSYGTEPIPLFPYLRAGLSKKGGSVGISPVNQILVTDHGFIRVPDLKSTQACEFVVFHLGVHLSP